MKMRARTATSWLMAVSGLIVPAGSLMAQSGRRVDDAVLRNAGKTGEQWLTYGSTPQETRFSPLNQINAANVSRLGLAWTYDAGPGGGSQEATPLVWNDTIYSITTWSVVFAVDARTGKERWRWDPEVNQTAVRPKICCGVANRGIALYDGKIIAPVIDGRLEALDAMTGKPVWESRVSYSQDNYTITMAPRIAKGKVIIGVSGAEFPVRGFIAAFDANTGRPAWKFYTVPGDPSKPYENAAMKKAAETWDPAALKLGGGGGTVWDAISYDPETDLIYFGTGNAGPWPEALRNAKGKDNLYACSIIALKADTGEYRWHFQMVPGDEWDYDSVQQLMLADLTIKGRQRKVLMQANKNGFYYVLDRTTGQFISGQPFAKVTWAKGLDEATGHPFINPEAYYDKEAISITPGPGGAHNWAPMSFNPSTGLVYIPNSSGGAFSYAVQPNFTYKPGEMNLGIVFGPPGGGRGGRGGAAPAGEVATAAATAATAAPSAAPVKPPAPRPAPPSIGPDGQGGSLVAWDPVTEKERWRATGGGSFGGGTVTTAGNLVFQVLPDGRLRVFSADKGEQLLEIQTGMRGGTGPPVTYMIDGKQYVAFMAGTGKVVGGLAGAAPPAASAAPPPPTPKLLTFVLDGKAPLPLGAATK
jgi:quinohemoprotein ethanol dehydrogenase